MVVPHLVDHIKVKVVDVVAVVAVVILHHHTITTTCSQVQRQLHGTLRLRL